MIDSIQLINFQSHKNTILEFHEGVNAIIGPSDNGKTSILRGLYLTRYNKPSGDAFVSKWARDKKGKQKKQMSVIVQKDKNILTRGKGPDLNGYDINDSISEALGKGGLPQDVVTFFNTTDVNIQEQMDRPFLIGSTPPEIAKFLNNIVDMSEIDLYLAAAESKKRSNNKDVKRVGQEIKDLEKEYIAFEPLGNASFLCDRLLKLNIRKNDKISTVETLTYDIDTIRKINKKLSVWSAIDDVDGLLKKLISIKSKIESKETDIRVLNSHVAAHKRYSKIIDSAKKVDRLSTLVTLLSKKHTAYLEKYNESEKLNDSIRQYKETKEQLKKHINPKKLIVLLKEITKVKKDLYDKNDNLVTLQNDIKAYRENIHTTIFNTAELKKLQESLPKLCPVCGGKLGKKEGVHGRV